MNILLSSVGRRNYLVEFFREVAWPTKVNVIAVDCSENAPGLVEADIGHTVPRIDDPGYIGHLLEVCRRYEVRLLVPLNDLELVRLAESREKFREVGTIPLVPPPEIAQVCADKWRSVEFLESLGVPTARTYLSSQAALDAVQAGEVNFPLVVKPRWGSASTGVMLSYDEAELRQFEGFVTRSAIGPDAFEVHAEQDEPRVIFQERLEGEEHGLDIVNDLRGHTVAHFAKRKLAMRAGETDRARIVEGRPFETIAHLLGNACKHLGNLDCDVFRKGDELRVLELNPRFGGGYPFSHQAGANLPAALVAWAAGEVPKKDWLEVKVGRTFAKCDRIVRTNSVQSVS